MKKATLICLLFVSSISISQSITWNNPVTAIAPGETISLDVSYDAGTEDFFYVSLILREVDASFNIVNDYNQTFPVNESSGEQPNTQSNVMFDYTIDAMAPDSSSLPSGNQYLMIVFMSYNNDGGFANDNMSITLDSTLSIGDFSRKEKFTGFYPNPVKDIMHFEENRISDQYRIIDLNGRIVKSGKSESTTLDVQDLKTGTYFIETDNRIGKFVKSN